MLNIVLILPAPGLNSIVCFVSTQVDPQVNNLIMNDKYVLTS